MGRGRWIAAAAALLGLALIGYALFAQSSDEELIRARLEQLEKAVAVEGKTNPLMRTSQLNREFAEIFEKDVTYRIPELTTATSGRKDLARLAAQAGMRFQTLDLRFTSIAVQLTGGGTGATVTSRATVTGTRSGQRVQRDDRSVRFQFSKTDGEWQIAGFTVTPRDEEDD